jgi:hypothetical protein
MTLLPIMTRNLDAENPWPGLMSFTEATQAYFHGRDDEAAELLRRVRRERLTIFFGPSGLGKTSLLCAGLFPRLRAADFLPVYIRLDWMSEQISPVAQIKQALAHNLTEYGVEGRPPDSDETLWAYFHDKETEFWSRRNRLITLVLVFDQFEEIFTLGDRVASAEAALDELAGLVKNRPPASVRSALEDDPEAARRYDFGKEGCRVILALREDFLPDLEGLRRQMPSIMDNRMRLTRMDGQQARDVIRVSGGHLIAAGVAEKIIAFVAERRHGSEELAGFEIEPALLSIVCRELNNKRIRLGQAQITPDLLEGAQQEIVAEFYVSSFAGIDPAVRLFIEEQLLTSEGYRDSRPLADALRELGVTSADIDLLVDRRLLRVEERFGTQWVELTHDLLTGVIRQQRDLRREQSRAVREAEERAQAERERLRFRDARGVGRGRGRLGMVQLNDWAAVVVKVLRFVSLLSVALIFGLAFCDVMEMPGKLRLSGAEWLVVQQNLYIASGVPIGAAIEVASILTTWLLAFVVWDRRPASYWTLAAAICVSVGLAEWFVIVRPMNAILSAWTSGALPADWTRVRDRWELGHAIHAALFGLGFSALVIALLAETQTEQPS